MGADVLLISGIREAGAFPIDDGIDTLLLPALAKVDNLDYRPRRLGVDLARLVAMRSSAVRAALSEFRPHVFIADNVPRGAVGELDETLRRLRAESTYCVLGLRDVLDAPSNVRREWEQAQNFTAIEELYDRVWIYGDPAVFDSATEYGLPNSIRSKTTFTGYLDPLWDRPDGRRQVRPTDHPDMCLVGGGHDGRRVAAAFADACGLANRQGLILAGPFMSESDIHSLDVGPKVTIRRFSSDPISLYRDANRIVAMGGYNTVLELISLGKRPLIVPRVAPRLEQLVRAEALDRRGLVDVLHPENLTPHRIAQWLQSEERNVNGATPDIDMTGLDTIVTELTALQDRTQLALTG